MEFDPTTTYNEEKKEDSSAQPIKLGTPLEAGKEVASKEQVIAALRTIEDPEIFINIYDMGLIYRADVSENGDVDIDMTLTAPACPVAGDMPMMAASAVEDLEGVGVVTLNIVWEPIWTPDRMTEEARIMLDIF